MDIYHDYSNPYKNAWWFTPTAGSPVTKVVFKGDLTVVTVRLHVVFPKSAPFPESGMLSHPSFWYQSGPFVKFCKHQAAQTMAALIHCPGLDNSTRAAMG